MKPYQSQSANAESRGGDFQISKKKEYEMPQKKQIVQKVIEWSTYNNGTENYLQITMDLQKGLHEGNSEKELMS